MRKKSNANEIMHFAKTIMQYCINALLKNNNEIMQYYIINRVRDDTFFCDLRSLTII